MQQNICQFLLKKYLERRAGYVQNLKYFSEGRGLQVGVKQAK